MGLGSGGVSLPRMPLRSPLSAVSPSIISLQSLVVLAIHCPTDPDKKDDGYGGGGGGGGDQVLFGCLCVVEGLLVDTSGRLLVVSSL